MADNKMEKSIKEAIGKSLNEFNKRIGMAKLIKDNKNQDRILKGILSQVNDENIEKTEKSNVITLDNSTDGIVELQEIKGDTNVNVSKIEKETPITHVIDDKNGNVISLDGITEGAINIDDIQGNTMVNCNKDTDKELILMPNLETNGYSNITLTEGIDGGKVDVALEGNTMVNVCDQEEPVAITKSYTVDTGNHIALQGEYDGKCRPNIYGNTLVNLIDLKTPTLERPVESTIIYNITNKNGYIKVTTNSAIKETWLYVKFPGLKSSMFKPSTTYTICFNKLKGVAYLNLVNGNGTNNFIANNIVTTDNKLMYTFTTKATLTLASQILYFGISQSNPLDIEIEKPIILEGDYTNKPIPDYFTGMKSSFEDKLVPENLASNVANNGLINKQYATLSTVNVSKLKRNTKYTTFIKNDGDENIQVYSNDTGGNFNFSAFTVSAKSSKVVTISTKDAELDTTKQVWLSLYVTETLPQNISAYLVEGDYTNYDFTDYDSTKGGKYKVDYKVTGKNKVVYSGNNPKNGINAGYNSGLEATVESDYSVSIKGTNTRETDIYFIGMWNNPQIRVKGGIYTISANCNGLNVGIFYIIEKGTSVITSLQVGSNVKTTITTEGLTSVMLRLPAGTYDFNIKLQIEEGTTATDYEPYKESIKTLYLNSPLLEGDTIEQSGNNIIHNHRYGKVVLDGSEDEGWILHDNQPSDTSLIRFSIEMPSKKAGTFNIICDKMSIGSLDGNFENINTECISGHPVGVAINIWVKKGKLSTQDVTGFKQYLQQNPITVVYELATPTQEIISTNDNLLLDSYTNGHLDVDTVIPIDKVKFNGWGTLLKYLYPNQDYIVQFESDNLGKLSYIGMNYKAYYQDEVTKGVNRFIITTTEKIQSNFFELNGIGFNASKIVVTPKVDNDFGYFKGMKSVGECEGNKIEILSNNNGSLSNISTHNFSTNGQYVHHKLLEPIKNGESFKICYTNNSNKDVILGIALYYPSGIVYGSFGGAGSHSCVYTNNTGETLKEIVTYRDNDFDGLVIENFSITKVTDTKDTSFVDYKPYKHNKKEILLSEPLRGLPNGVKDKYVMIDGKWYIERNCGSVTLDGSENWSTMSDDNYTRGWTPSKVGNNAKLNTSSDNKLISDEYAYIGNDGVLKVYKGEGCAETFYRDSSDKQIQIKITNSKLQTVDTNGFRKYLQNNNCRFIYQLAQPTYEPIDYNPFEVYTDITHISNNSTIPCNMVIRNSGFNCILKPNTKYTVSSNNGLSTVTTKDSIGDSVLRFYNKDTSKITKMSKVLVLEGDYVTGNPPIPGFFKGMESAFEQELVTDETSEYYGKYKVNVKTIGKNLLDETKGVINSSMGNSKTICIKVKPNTTYVYSSSVYKEAIAIYQLPSIVDNSIIIQKLANMGYNSSAISDSQSFTTSGSTNYIFMNYDRASNVQIEQGDKPTEYEPYKENNITFYLNEPLRGVGDVKDKVYVKEDKVVVERNCIEFPLESTQFPSVSIRGNTGLFMYNIPTNNPIVNNNRGKVVCNNFPCDVENAHSRKYPNTISTVVDSSVPNGVIRIITDKNANTIKQYIQNNPTTVVYQLATPTYEEVEYSNNRLTLNTYNNSTLFYNSNIPISNTSFKPLWEELIYIKNSTTYYIQFNAVGNGNVVVNLGGTELTTAITKGYNKIEITTSNNSTNLLTIDGQGIKISKVVVSEALCSGYYKGLQSCFEEHMENGKYVCVIRGISLDGNKVNGIKFYLNKPLRGIGNIKDRLCIKDGKLMVERNCGEVIFDGSKDEYYYESYVENEEGYYRYMTKLDYNSNNYKARNIHSVNNKYFNRVNQSHGNYSYVYCQGTDKDVLNIYIQSNDFTTFDEFSTLLKNNPLIIVYELEIPTYEEVTNEYGLPIILEGYENGIVYVDSSVTPTTSIKYTSNNKVPATLSNVDNLNTTTQNDINNNIVTYMMDIDMMLTEMEMDDSTSVMSLSDSDDNNQNHDGSHNNILDRMNKEDRIKYQDNTTKMLEKVIKGKSLTKEENINRIDLYLSEGKIRKEQSNYLKELLKGVE